jgi:hypothetical protein
MARLACYRSGLGSNVARGSAGYSMQRILAPVPRAPPQRATYKAAAEDVKSADGETEKQHSAAPQETFRILVESPAVSTAVNGLKHAFANNWDCRTGGERGIRTLDTGFSPYNGLANRRLQPLGHLSGVRLQQVTKVIYPMPSHIVKRFGVARPLLCHRAGHPKAEITPALRRSAEEIPRQTSLR